MKIISVLNSYLALGLLLIAGCESKPPVPKWAVHEIRLEAARTYQNPYLNMEVNGTFVSPNGDQKTIRAFWDGGNVFILRFTPDREGEWTYHTKVLSTDSPTGKAKKLEDPGLLKSGKLKVEAPQSGSHGFLRRDSEYPYHFIRDDGTRYYMCGTTYYNILLNAMQGDRWKTAVDSAMVYGINKFRAHAFPIKNSATPYPQVYPVKGTTDSLDHKHLNLPLWRKLDEVIEYSNSKGMVVDLMPFGFDRMSYSGDSLLDQHYLRYVIARYAAYPNIIWCVVNEWNYRQRRLGLSKPYFNAMGRIIRTEDPWMAEGENLRPLSIHQQTRIDFQFFNYDWPVHAIIQLGVRSGQGVVQDEWDIPAETQPLYRNGDEWGNAGIVYNLGHEMPVVNDEYGYMGEPRDRAASDSPNRDEWPTLTRERHRNIIWGIAVAGGYGSGGDKYSYKDGRPYFSANWHSEPAEYLDIKHLTDFFTSGRLEYWKMYSHNEIITKGNRVYAFAEPGRQYVFYAAAGGDFLVNLEPATYLSWRYDPRKGTYEESGDVEGGKVDLTLPDSTDWVLLLIAKK